MYRYVQQLLKLYSINALQSYYIYIYISNAAVQLEKHACSSTYTHTYLHTSISDSHVKTIYILCRRMNVCMINKYLLTRMVEITN